MLQPEPLRIGKPDDVAAILKDDWKHTRQAAFGFLCLDREYNVLRFAQYPTDKGFYATDSLQALAANVIVSTPGTAAVITARYAPDALFCQHDQNDRTAVTALRPTFSKASIHLIDHFVASRGSVLSLCVRGVMF